MDADYGTEESTSHTKKLATELRKIVTDPDKTIQFSVISQYFKTKQICVFLEHEEPGRVFSRVARSEQSSYYLKIIIISKIKKTNIIPLFFMLLI